MNSSELPEINEEEFNDEDFEEIDKFIEHLNTLPKPTATIIDHIRIKQMRFSYAAISRIIRETGSKATIKCECHQPIHSSGVIRVEGIDITVKDMELFCRAVEFSSNIEVYPLLGNKIRMALMFYGLTRPISYGEQ